MTLSEQQARLDDALREVLDVPQVNRLVVDLTAVGWPDEDW